ncbi:hypothetical protein GCM10011506_00780 [Marivirga lumbricoides]|uniref:DUF4180 domain-containing protein n=1 Tax=Marivirga lumbricoides TaxID=1046115 RepID=A0ABQ1L7U0_9BACT|nr:hypothetical protein GCM10011506_00780 [Marivirga lumbricoides]
MEIVNHQINDIEIAELISNNLIINTIDDGADLVGNLFYGGFNRVVIYEKNIAPEFFDLKSGLAGEILQKFTNYRVYLIIVGDFSKYHSKSLKAFIYESNNSRHVNFVASQAEALKILSTK